MWLLLIIETRFRCALSQTRLSALELGQASILFELLTGDHHENQFDDHLMYITHMRVTVVSWLWVGLSMACSGEQEVSVIPDGPKSPDRGEMPYFERPELSNTRDGLASVHRSQIPVFDRFKVSRDRESMEGHRLYADGTQYFIRKHFWRTNEAGPSWEKQFQFTAKGVQLVKEVLHPLHGEHTHTHTNEQPATGSGSTTWVSYHEGSEIVFRTGEAAYACPLSIRNSIGQALTQNVVRSADK